ncbi:ribonuclease T2-like, partial [Ascosphaera atra]
MEKVLRLLGLFGLLPLLTAAGSDKMIPLILPSDLGNPRSCPVDSPLSCHAKSGNLDTCCLNSPGGLLMQTQFWDTDPVAGPDDSWTVHGLWPDNCDGSFDQFCDRTRQYFNITDILTSFEETALLDDMDRYWKDQYGDDENLWEHEWNKHGTCMSTLEPKCYDEYKPQQEVVAYFQRTIDLFKGLDSYKVGFGERWDCPECQHGRLNELWYFFNIRGSAQSGQFVPTNPDGNKNSCPKSGIRYLPKHSKHGDDPSHTHPPGSKPTGPPFAGKGHLKVTANGHRRGCLISDGTWYVGGACATYTATPGDDGFRLRSKRGDCGIVNGAFACGGRAKSQVFK